MDRRRPPLDMVKFYTDLEDGDSLEMIIDAPTNKDDAPAFRKSMTNLEIAELIKNSYINAGRQQFAISSMKPAMFANKKGIRVDFSYKTKKGLDKRGFAVGAIFDDKLNLAIYTGTEEYYFPKYKYEVEKMLMALEHIENKS